jgi:hypothetical protein
MRSRQESAPRKATKTRLKTVILSVAKDPSRFPRRQTGQILRHAQDDNLVLLLFMLFLCVLSWRLCVFARDSRLRRFGYNTAN